MKYAEWAAIPETLNADNLAVTIISCVQRTETRRATVKQLEAVGLHPIVFLSPCQPADSRGNAIVSHEALSFGRGTNRDLLFCEDDLDLNPGAFARMLNLARASERTTYLYSHDGNNATRVYENSVRNSIGQRTIAPGLYESQTQMLGGAQCIYIPQAILAQLDISLFIGRRLAIDIFLTNQMLALNQRPLVAIPHPVQHRWVRVAREPDDPDKVKVSQTYPLWSEP